MKLPTDAFHYYFALGDGRSYQDVADNYSVSKTAVVNRAAQEKWQERIEQLEAKARESSDKKLLENLEQMNERHLKMARMVQAKALETLKNMPLSTAMEAVRAMEFSVKQERLIRGEPSDRTAVSMEDTIRREYQRWLVVEEGDDAPSTPPE